MGDPVIIGGARTGIGRLLGIAWRASPPSS